MAVGKALEERFSFFDESVFLKEEAFVEAQGSENIRSTISRRPHLGYAWGAGFIEGPQERGVGKWARGLEGGVAQNVARDDLPDEMWPHRPALTPRS